MKTIVCGRTIEYGVDEKTGMFEALWDEQQHKCTTLASLKSSLERQLKKKPLNIPVVRVERSVYSETLVVTTGIITAVHSSNGNLLIRWKGSEGTEQYRGDYNHRTLLRSGTDVKKLKDLYNAVRKAEEAYNEFKNMNGFDRSVIKDD